MSADPL